MSLPFVSCRCITNARVAHLEEAIQSFLQQDYPGPKELVILNDCPEQYLTFHHPDVLVVNVANPYQHLSRKENDCIRCCSGGVIFVWDDDDLYLPHYLRVMVEQMLARKFQWIQSRMVWQFDGRRIFKPLAPANCAGMIYTKEAWNIAGRHHPAMNSGHDQYFINNLKKHCLGGAIELPEQHIGFGYGWGNGVYHASGLGIDTPDRPSCIQRHREDALHRFASGDEPIGLIKLQPHWNHDYLSQWLRLVELPAS